MRPGVTRDAQRADCWLFQYDLNTVIGFRMVTMRPSIARIVAVWIQFSRLEVKNLEPASSRIPLIHNESDVLDISIRNKPNTLEQLSWTTGRDGSNLYSNTKFKRTKMDTTTKDSCLNQSKESRLSGYNQQVYLDVPISYPRMTCDMINRCDYNIIGYILIRIELLARYSCLER